MNTDQNPQSTSLALCKYCKRPLKSASSIERGCGSSCAKKNNQITRTYKRKPRITGQCNIMEY